MDSLRLFQTTAFFLLIPISAEAQEIASKDLVRTSPIVEEPSRAANKSEYPNGCEKMGVGFADGMAFAESKKPRQISVELVTLSNTNLILGSEIVATVKLRNAGSDSIQIPWSTDFRTTQDGQDTNNRTWEFGQFRIAVRNKKDEYDELINTSQPLYGSKFVPDSFLTIKPGEWIKAKISFRVAAQHPAYETINEGPADLALEWFQTVRTYVVKGCGVTLGYYPYDGFYAHHSRTIVRKVEIKRSEKTTAPNK